MSIRTTDERNVALYDSTTGIAFGPVFEGRDEADAFMRWTRGNGWVDIRQLTPERMGDLSTAWATFLTFHTEPECPFDGDDVPGGGWTNASDSHSGPMEYNVEARPHRCDCECHTRVGGVHATERSR